MLLGMAPVEVFSVGGGGLTLLSVTFSEFTSWLELLSDTEVSALFTDSVLSDTLLVSRLFSALDGPTAAVARVSLGGAEMVAALMRVIRSVMVERASDSGRSVSIPESKRRSYCDTESALKELSLELSERSMSLSSYGLEVEGRSYLAGGKGRDECGCGKLSSTHWLVASECTVAASSVDSVCALLLRIENKY